MEHNPITSMVGKKTRQIWEAYQEVLKELHEKESVPSTTEAAAERRKVDAITHAEKLDVDYLVSSLGDLADGLQSAANSFAEVNLAIDEKKKELKDVHSLQVEADSLVAVLAAKDTLIQERDDHARQIIIDAKATAITTIENACHKAQSIKDAAEEQNAEVSKARVRAEEAWEYSFKRQRRDQTDQAQDKIDQKLKDLVRREEKIGGREQFIETLDGEIVQLKGQLDSTEIQTLDRIKDAVEIAKTMAAKGAAIQKQIIEQKLQGEMAVLQAENNNLQSTLADLKARLDRAEHQIHAANDRVTTIATSAMRREADAATVAEVSKIAAGSGQKK